MNEVLLTHWLINILITTLHKVLFFFNEFCQVASFISYKNIKIIYQYLRRGVGGSSDVGKYYSK